MLVRIWCAVVALTDRGQGGEGAAHSDPLAPILHLTQHCSTPSKHLTQNLVMLREKNVPQKFKVNFRNLILRE